MLGSFGADFCLHHFRIVISRGKFCILTTPSKLFCKYEIFYEEETLNDFETHFRENPSEGGKRKVMETIETIRNNIAFARRHEHALIEFLHPNKVRL